MTKTFQKTVMFALALLAVLLMGTACQPEVVIEEAQTQAPAAPSQTSGQPKEAGETPEALGEPAEDEGGSQAPAASGDMALEPLQPGGQEPDPDSPFGQLSPVDQQALISWLNELTASYDVINDALAKFSAADFSQLEEGQTLKDLELFSETRTAIEEELAKMEGLEALPQAASSLEEAASKLNSWYGDFMAQLADLKPQEDGVEDLLNQGLDQATQLMQGFIDALVAFSS